MESILLPELKLALADWIQSANVGVVIGGVAVSYWGLPRYTTDVDVMFLNGSDIPTYVEGFRLSRPHTFVHKATGIEIEVLDAAFLKFPHNVVEQIIQDSVVVDGIRIASKSGLVASKLW